MTTGGVTNAGTILVKGSALSVSSSSITSSDAQSYLSSINLLNDLTLTGTMISTDQSITGNDFDLTLAANWTSGSTVSGVKRPINLWFCRSWKFCIDHWDAVLCKFRTLTNCGYRRKHTRRLCDWQRHFYSGGNFYRWVSP